jgi:hypothetical protein
MKRLFILLATVLAASAHADCVCRCVNGQVRPICSNALDLPPICAPQLCALTPPSIAPLQMPSIPPLGTQNCREAQVLNPYSGRYEWRTLCQ